MEEKREGGSLAIPERIAQLLNAETLSVLATTGPNGPHACLILFAASVCLDEIYFATNTDTVKYQNIIAEPRVSLLLDNRTTRGATGCGIALTLTGHARVLEGDAAQSALQRLQAKNNSLGATVSADVCAVVAVRLGEGRLVSTDEVQLYYNFNISS